MPILFRPRLLGNYPQGGGGGVLAPTLSVVDNGDGTGGIATVSGSTGGSTNTLYAAPYSGVNGSSMAWSSVGSRTGDGAVTFGSTGAQFFYVLSSLSGNSAVSSIVFCGITGLATGSIHKACLDAYVTRIQGLGLSGILSSSVDSRWLPRVWEDIDTLAFPRIMVSPVGTEQPKDVMSTRDDIELPVLVSIVDKQNQDYVANQDRNLLWREKIASAFRHQRLVGVQSILTTDVEYQPVVDPANFQKNLFYSSILFRPRSRQTRG